MECPICMLAINTWALSLLRVVSFKGTSSHHFWVCYYLDTNFDDVARDRYWVMFRKKGPEVNHLLVMDGLKLFAKTESQIDSLMQKIYAFVIKTLVWNLVLQSVLC